MKTSLISFALVLTASFAFFSCQPKCKTCTAVNVSEIFQNGTTTGSGTTEATQEYCDDLLEMVEAQPVIVTESENIVGSDTILTVITVTTTCQ